MTCVRIIGRSGLAAAMLGVVGATALAGTSPVSLVSFDWGANASGSAGVLLSCDPECAPLIECTNQPGTSFSYGGTQMVATTISPVQAARNCGGSCGGAGLATSFFQANGGAEIDAPLVSPGYTQWSFTNGISGQVGAGAGFACGSATTSASVQSSHFCDIVFDIGPGHTIVTLSYQHFVNGEDATTASVWTIGNAQTSFFSQSIDAANGANFNVGQVERVLPAGRYHLRLDASLSENAAATSQGSQSLISSAGIAFSLTFQTYVCASVTTPPQPASVCPSGTGQFAVVADGTAALAHKWQWLQVGEFPNVWVDVVQGVNMDAGGTARFVADGAETPILRVTRDTQPLGGIGVIQAVRCVVTNVCGDAVSQPAELRVCRGDLNCDGTVNTADLVAFLGQFGVANHSGSGADINLDGAVNTIDLTQFLGAFGQGCG